MSQTLKIQGMHCGSCVGLISMELEDAGTDMSKTEVGLSGDNTGYVRVDSDDADTAAKVRAAVEAAGEYQVIG